MKHFFILSLVICLFSSCEDTVLTNQEVRNLVPGGKITTSLSGPAGLFSLVNDSFNTYGCYQHESDGVYYFYISVSGEKNNMFYFFEGSGGISQSDMDFLEVNPGTQFSLYDAEAEVELKNGASTYYTTYHPPESRVPAMITLSNFGEIGDPVTVNFTFQTSNVAGFSNMSGTIQTRYVIYQY